MLANFLIRWLLSGLGLWVAAIILGSSHMSVGHTFVTLLGAGFFLALVNFILKPIIIFLSIPAILLSLGFFMLVVNGLMIYIAAHIYSPLYVSSFWVAVLAGVVISIVNFLVYKLAEDFKK